MKGIFNATWGDNKVHFEICEVQELAGAFIAVKGTTTNHFISNTNDLEENDDVVGVYDLIKDYCLNKSIELAPQFEKRNLRII